MLSLVVSLVLLQQVPNFPTVKVGGVEMIEIDGAKYPSWIPDYYLWESGFRYLARLQTDASQGAREGVAHDMKLSLMELNAVFRVAQAQLREQAACVARVKAKRQELTAAGWRPDDITIETRKIILDCREISLRGERDLAEVLTPDGLVRVVAWMNKGRANVTVTLLPPDLDFFRRPR